MAENLKKEQSQQTKNRILDTAVRLFVKKGYSGTSIATIAKASNITSGAIYCHFDSKSDLLQSVIKKWETDFLDRIIEEVNATKGDTWDKLHRLVSYSSKFAEENRELCVLVTTIAAELYDDENEFFQEFRRIYSKYEQFIRGIVAEGKRKGIFDTHLDNHTLACVIFAFSEGILLLWQRSRNILDGPELVRTWRQVLFHGVRPRED